MFTGVGDYSELELGLPKFVQTVTAVSSAATVPDSEIHMNGVQLLDTLLVDNAVKDQSVER